MEDSNKQYISGEINKAGQSSSVGLIIRQKEPTNLETALRSGRLVLSLRWSCSTYAVISRHRS